MRLFKKSQTLPMKDQLINFFNAIEYKFQIIEDSEDKTVFKTGVILTIGNADGYLTVNHKLKLVELFAHSPLKIPENKLMVIDKTIYMTDDGQSKPVFKLEEYSRVIKYVEIDGEPTVFVSKYLNVDEAGSTPTEIYEITKETSNLIFTIPKNWNTEQDYIDALSKKYRDQYKRARKKADELFWFGFVFRYQRRQTCGDKIAKRA